jgi:glycosyltransferase 2 family protein
MTKKLIFTLVKTAVPLLLGLYLIVHSFSSMSAGDKIEFYKAIREANYGWIILALLFSFLAFISRAYRWKFALEPLGYSTKFWNRYHAIMIGYIMNLTIPRAGEASRAAMLYRSEGVPFSTSFGSIIAERAVDFILLLAIGATGAFLGYDDFFKLLDQIKTFDFGGTDHAGGFPWKIVIIGGLGVGFFFFLFVLVRKQVLRAKILSFIKEVFLGLFSIFKLQQPVAYIGHTLLIWICYLLMFGLPFFALEQTSHFTLAGIFIGFIAGSLGIVLTNGGIGTYPILVGLVVAFYIGDKHPETAFGIGTALGWIIWLSQTVLMIILGLVSLIILPKNHAEEHDKTPAHTAKISEQI